MAAQYYDLKVKKIDRETPDAVSVHFEKPEGADYDPGQFLTLILNIDGEEVRRSYSLSSSPVDDDTLTVTVKRVEGGKVSNYIIDHLQEGETVRVMEPAGVFRTVADAKKARHVILLGGGSGITPLMSILKTVLKKEPESHVSLIYANRDEQSIIFKERLDKIKDEYGDRFDLIHVLSRPSENWNGLKARLSQERVIEFLNDLPAYKDLETEYFICGPEGLMDEIKKAFARMDIPQEKIHQESFVASKNPATQEDKSDSGEEAELKTRDVTVIFEGEEFKITVPPDSTILETALDEGIDLPFSCQSGLCSTCMGVLKSGKVKMDQNEALTGSEVEEGYVLNCQSHPLTDDVVVEIE